MNGFISHGAMWRALALVGLLLTVLALPLGAQEWDEDDEAGAPLPNAQTPVKPKQKVFTAPKAAPPARGKTPAKAASLLPKGRFCAWLLWSKKPEVIKEAQARIGRGEHFVVVAGELAKRDKKKAKQSEETHANVDCMNAGRFAPPVLSVLAKLKIGKIGGPIKLAGGQALVMRTTDVHRQRGLDHFKAKRYAQAEKELLADVKLQPVNSWVFHTIAFCRSARGDHRGALKALDQAIKLKPKDYRILSDKGTTLMNLGRLDQAIAVYELALEIDPHNPAIQGNLAEALAKQGKDLERAQDILNDALDRAPRLASLWVTQAMIQQADGDRGGAVVSLHKAARLEPGSKKIERLLLSNLRAMESGEVSKLVGPDANPPPPPPAPARPPRVAATPVAQEPATAPPREKLPPRPRPLVRSKVEAAAPQPPEPPPEPVPAQPARPTGSYFIQTGTFQKITVAQSEVDRLEKNGLQAKLVAWQGAEGDPWQRVMVGPYDTYDQALSKARGLEKKGLLRIYLVVQAP